MKGLFGFLLFGAVRGIDVIVETCDCGYANSGESFTVSDGTSVQTASTPSRGNSVTLTFPAEATSFTIDYTTNNEWCVNLVSVDGTLVTLADAADHGGFPRWMDANYNGEYRGEGVQHYGYNSVQLAFNVPSGDVGGDPHVTNIHGKHFMLTQTGRVNLLSLTRPNQVLADFYVHADLESVNNVQCSPSYIRKISVNSGNSSIAARRGDVSFAETASEPFQVAVNGGSWTDMNRNFTSHDEMLVVTPTGSEAECVEDTQTDCSGFIVHSSYADVRVSATKSAHGLKHYLNAKVMAVKNAKDLSPSGILWDDAVVSSPCK